MKFIDLVMEQELSDTELLFAEHICKQPWREFSNTIGNMNKSDTLKVLKYLIKERPESHTLGRRVVQRYNSLNKVKWEDLVNGRKTGKHLEEES